MAKRFSLTLRPIKGSNGVLSPSDPSLVEKLDDGSFRVYDVYDHSVTYTGYNYSYGDNYGELIKCPGDAVLFSTNTMNTNGFVQNIGFLDDGTIDSKQLWCLVGAKFYTLNVSTGTQTNIDATTPGVSLGSYLPVSAIQYGSYVVLCGPNLTFSNILPPTFVTPYKWKIGDANLTKLILSGTEYKFRYIEVYNNRIVGAYSDQTNGHLDVRWTEALPSMATLSFPAANQLYKPDDDYGITGLKTMGSKALLLYGKETVTLMDYTPDYTPVFTMTPVLTGCGTQSPYSIVDIGSAHYFFDQARGFVRYQGGSSYQVVSQPIEWLIAGIDPANYTLVQGYFDKVTGELAWSIPYNTGADGVVYPNAIAYFHPELARWRVERRGSTAFYSGEQYSKQSSKHISRTLFGLSSASHPNWIMRIGLPASSLGSTEQLTSMAGATYQMYFNMPIFGFPDPKRTKRFQEIHLFTTNVNAAIGSTEISWRGGDNEQAVNAASWTVLGSITQTSTSSQILYCDVTAKIHQFRVGNNSSTAVPSMNKIELVGYMF